MGSNIENILKEVEGIDDLKELSRLINEKIDSQTKLNHPLLDKVKKHFSGGSYFCKPIGNAEDFCCTYGFQPEIRVSNQSGTRIDIVFKESYVVTLREGVVSIHESHIYHLIDTEEKLEMWEDSEEYIFKSSKDLLHDLSKKVKKWMENKTL